MHHFQDNLLANKKIVITGGATGLGFSMAKKAVMLGAKVLITSRKEEKLKQAQDELHEISANSCLYTTCDVRNDEEVQKMIAFAADEFEGFNVLINNAAGNFISPTERLSSNAFKTIVDIVLTGTANCTLAAGKHWIATNTEAVVLNIATTYAHTGSAFVVPSAAAKAGVVAMIKSLAVEWAKYKIRHVGIAPGPFPTPGAWQRLFPEPIQKMLDPKERIPLGRFGEHDELSLSLIHI